LNFVIKTNLIKICEQYLYTKKQEPATKFYIIKRERKRKRDKLNYQTNGSLTSLRKLLKFCNKNLAF